MKQAAKEGGGGASKQAAANAAGADTKPSAAVVPSQKVVAPNLSTIAPMSMKNVAVSNLQVLINPNTPLPERPVVAMAVAVLTQQAVGLNLVSDHRCRHTCLGTPSGAVVTGDLAMARYLTRLMAGDAGGKDDGELLVPVLDPDALGMVDSYVDYAQSLSLLDAPQRVRACTLTLHHALQQSTYLVGDRLTLADLALFAALGFPTQAADRKSVLQQLGDGDSATTAAARRWINMLAAHPALQEATQLCLGIANNVQAVFDETVQLDPLVTGMNALEGGMSGRVVTRFPPEPSGYLHIGHAKAVLLNDYYAHRYQGRLIVRFDDTNPSKEKSEFEESIVEDLALLDVRPDSVSYTSDYFEAIKGYAQFLIRNGLGYMDDTPQEQIKAERAERKESKHRNQTPEDAMKFFDLMCSGSAEGAGWCLRAKIDMQSDNGTMRDPVLFRQNLTPHHRTGTSYKAYPTYDLACPIVDSLEGVTHALRTTEYNDRDEQYQWLLKVLGLRRVRIHAFSRVNFMYTVLSKRKLVWFVEKGLVTGWDDARFPTVRGVVRRGIDITALRNFIYSQGASRNVVNLHWSTFWAENKKEIDKRAKRFMAIDKKDHVRLKITNGPSESDFSFVETTYHPKDPSLGKRVIRLSNDVLIEKVDTVTPTPIEVGEDIVLLRWGVVKITKVEENGLEGEYIPNGDFKAAKRKLSWVANVSTNTPVVLTEFDNLVTKEKLEEDDNFEDHINPDTIAATEVIGDAALKTLQEHDVIQLERRGFYRVDRPYLSAAKPLVLYMIPDGKTKSMSGMSGKLAHR